MHGTATSFIVPAEYFKPAARLTSLLLCQQTAPEITLGPDTAICGRIHFPFILYRIESMRCVHVQQWGEFIPSFPLRHSKKNLDLPEFSFSLNIRNTKLSLSQFIKQFRTLLRHDNPEDLSTHLHFLLNKDSHKRSGCKASSKSQVEEPVIQILKSLRHNNDPDQDFEQTADCRFRFHSF